MESGRLKVIKIISNMGLCMAMETFAGLVPFSLFILHTLLITFSFLTLTCIFPEYQFLNMATRISQ